MATARTDYKYYPLSLKCQARESVKKNPFNSLITNPQLKAKVNITSTVIQESISNAFPRISSPTIHIPQRAMCRENASTGLNMWWNNWPQQPLMSSRLPHYWTGSKRRVTEGTRAIHLSQPVIAQQPSQHLSDDFKFETNAKSVEFINSNDPFTTNRYDKMNDVSVETSPATAQQNSEKIVTKNHSLQPTQRNLSSKLSRRATSRPNLLKLKNSKLMSATRNEIPVAHGAEDVSSATVSDERFLGASPLALKRSHTFTEILQSRESNQPCRVSTSFISLADCGLIDSSSQDIEYSESLITWETKCDTWLTHMWLQGGARCLDDLCIYGFG